MKIPYRTISSFVDEMSKTAAKQPLGTLFGQQVKATVKRGTKQQLKKLKKLKKTAGLMDILRLGKEVAKNKKARQTMAEGLLQSHEAERAAVKAAKKLRYAKYDSAVEKAEKIKKGAKRGGIGLGLLGAGALGASMLSGDGGDDDEGKARLSGIVPYSQKDVAGLRKSTRPSASGIKGLGGLGVPVGLPSYKSKAPPSDPIQAWRDSTFSKKGSINPLLLASMLGAGGGALIAGEGNRTKGALLGAGLAPIGGVAGTVIAAKRALKHAPGKAIARGAAGAVGGTAVGGLAAGLLARGNKREKTANDMMGGSAMEQPAMGTGKGVRGKLMGRGIANGTGKGMKLRKTAEEEAGESVADVLGNMFAQSEDPYAQQAQFMPEPMPEQSFWADQGATDQQNIDDPAYGHGKGLKNLKGKAAPQMTAGFNPKTAPGAFKKKAGASKGLRAAARKMYGRLARKETVLNSATPLGNMLNQKAHDLAAGKTLAKEIGKARRGGITPLNGSLIGTNGTGSGLAKKAAARFFGNLAKQAGGTQKVIMGGTATPQPPAPPVPPPPPTVKTGARKR